MKALIPLIEQIVINGMMSSKAPMMRKNKYGLGLMALSVLLTLVAVVFLIISGYAWLMTQFTQPMAALITAAFIMGAAVISALTGVLIAKSKKQPEVHTDELAELTGIITDLLGEELAQPIIDNPKTAVLLASAAGFVAGDRLN